MLYFIVFVNFEVQNDLFCGLHDLDYLDKGNGFFQGIQARDKTTLCKKLTTVWGASQISSIVAKKVNKNFAL